MKNSEALICCSFNVTVFGLWLWRMSEPVWFTAAEGARLIFNRLNLSGKRTENKTYMILYSVSGALYALRNFLILYTERIN